MMVGDVRKREKRKSLSMAYGSHSNSQSKVALLSSSSVVVLPSIKDLMQGEQKSHIGPREGYSKSQSEGVLFPSISDAKSPSRKHWPDEFTIKKYPKSLANIPSPVNKGMVLLPSIKHPMQGEQILHVRPLPKSQSEGVLLPSTSDAQSPSRQTWTDEFTIKKYQKSQQTLAHQSNSKRSRPLRARCQLLSEFNETFTKVFGETVYEGLSPKKYQKSFLPSLSSAVSLSSLPVEGTVPLSMSKRLSFTSSRRYSFEVPSLLDDIGTSSLPMVFDAIGAVNDSHEVECKAETLDAGEPCAARKDPADNTTVQQSTTAGKDETQKPSGAQRRKGLRRKGTCSSMLRAVPVFEKFATDSLLPCTCTHSALQLLGHVLVDANNVETALKAAEAGKGSTKSSITLAEFSIFVDKYEALHEEQLQCLFKGTDKNGDGTLTRQELGSLMQQLEEDMGIKMFPHVIDELFKEADVDHTGAIDMVEFRQVMKYVRQRQGFSREEARDVMDAFKRFDREQSGEVQVSDLGQLLGWLGYYPEEQELAELSSEIDQDKSGTISIIEVPLFMRKYREHELEKVGHFFGTHDKDFNGSIDVQELPELLQDLGYPMSSSSMLSFLDETNLNQVAKRGLLSEDFLRLIWYIRKNEGFVANEVDEHYFAWARYAHPPEDPNDTGLSNLAHKAFTPMEERRTWQVPKHDVGKVLRWLGIDCFKLTRLMTLVEEVNVDLSPSLDFREFSKLMRRLHEKFHDIILRSFSSKEKLSSPDMDVMLHDLGIELIDEKKEEVFGEMKMRGVAAPSFFECLGIAQQMRYAMARSMRETAGFTAQEANEWRRIFDKFDKDKSDTITKDELKRMFEGTGALASASEEERKLISEDSERAGLGHGGIDFLEFLIVMRGHGERQEARRLKENEEKLAEEAKNAEMRRQKELQQAKELFKAVDESGDHQLSREEVETMASKMVDLSSSTMRTSLGNIFQEVDKDNSGHIDFDEFQGLIERLHQEDFGGMRTKADKMAAETRERFEAEARKLNDPVPQEWP